MVACVPVLASPAFAAGPKPITRTYQVADLVIPISDFQPAEKKERAATQEDQLIQMLVQTIQPATWDSNGGSGTIQYFPLTNTLVVNQTPDIQEQVADLLAALRRLQSVQVALEIRIISTSDDAPERIGVDFNAPPPPQPRKSANGVNFLNTTQVVRMLEAVQGDKRANIMQAPKMTMLSGQTGTICTPGYRMTARPIVSADRKFVQLALNVDLTDTDEAAPKSKPATTSFNNTLTIPDGGTVLMSGLKKEVETRCEVGVPVMSRVPYVGRLFRSVGYGRESQSLLVMVTPRIIVEEEEEAKVPPTVRVVEEQEKPVKECSCRKDKVVAGLLKAYEEACAEGRHDEAKKYAEAALSIDPACFRRNP
jgi:type II secretory pathway component GspD/PulD (secretin)